jgi:hypothetical protein
VVSAKKLKPWSTSAIMYIAKLLKKELILQEIMQIDQVATLPRDHKVIEELLTTIPSGPRSAGCARRISAERR